MDVLFIVLNVAILTVIGLSIGLSVAILLHLNKTACILQRAINEVSKTVDSNQAVIANLVTTLDEYISDAEEDKTLE
mgnify:CR=1 FL=1